MGFKSLKRGGLRALKDMMLPVLGVTTQSSVYTSNINVQQGGTALLIIDPQNDFHPGGSLAIDTADEDAQRIKSLIENQCDGIAEIYVTLDSHMKYHIAHSQFWIDSRSEHPAPFTTISEQDVKDGKWMASRKEHRNWTEHYVRELEKKGHQLIIWPEHCLIGTHGHCVQDGILEALHKWEAKSGKSVHYVLKGTNSKTEHYSAIKAEVVVPEDEINTDVNFALVNDLKLHNRVLICGQALSHCVNYTTRDLVCNWGDNQLESLVILDNATSPVAGFEEAGSTFLKEMREAGLLIKQTTDKDLII
mmetsp:Transcript_28725/g.35291  ORF Transcript_28725/g.35291 Transcript_28725/m.35291 type:complete len:305 (+) Transcript_28725:222-1136(+)|eukprot:CAMPEP_0204827568 /NCGR_PEP_ID=MMETSP1346-20131115/5005_1 /ASSEMBLY_ACC=CAM_ASM_000771 /TAXON_ID=215587 /ORGANISM="Aplanochytrium stocchinoi, Strain GSBS06" /LENGTH=304 /DNA_ID=CAMNT_0051956049 /DNA_START=215 /DNA_END=1129 /DNA_ORIENTATION=-